MKGEDFPFPLHPRPAAEFTEACYAAWSRGKSTESQVESPMHFVQRGKLASFSSICSTPQHSDAYKPVINTSCPVFIFSPQMCNRMSYRYANSGPLYCHSTVSYSLPR